MAIILAKNVMKVSVDSNSARKNTNFTGSDPKKMITKDKVLLLFHVS